jgi:hypothetical protein
MNKYEDYFEGARDRSIVISDLIEQIVLVDEVINRHKEANSEGMMLEQYVERKQEFSTELNSHLEVLNMMLVDKKGA